MNCSTSNCLCDRLTEPCNQCVCVMKLVWLERRTNTMGSMNHSAGHQVEWRLEGAVIIATILLLFPSLLLPSPAGKFTYPRLSTTNFAATTWLVPINLPSISSSLALLLSWWALKDGTHTWSHYLRKKVSIHKMEHHSRAMTSTRTLSEPKISTSSSFIRCHWEGLWVCDQHVSPCTKLQVGAGGRKWDRRSG
jgi:hypothetical protein